MKKLIMLAIFPFFFSCQEKTKTKSNSIINTETHQSIVENDFSKADHKIDSIDSQTVVLIKSFLVKQYKNDLSYLTEEDKKFSFYELDLNNDSKNEYLVYLQGRYFCGTGGCTFFLLNNDFTVNTTFTVMRPPVFLSDDKTNGWKDIILAGNYQNDKIKNYIYLKYDKTKNKYQNNPSIIKKSEKAPAGKIVKMWTEVSNFPKIYSF